MNWFPDLYPWLHPPPPPASSLPCIRAPWRSQTPTRSSSNSSPNWSLWRLCGGRHDIFFKSTQLNDSFLKFSFFQTSFFISIRGIAPKYQCLMGELFKALPLINGLLFLFSVCPTYEDTPSNHKHLTTKLMRNTLLKDVCWMFIRDVKQEKISRCF